MDDVDLFDGGKDAVPEMAATEISEVAPEMSAINEAIDAAMVAPIEQASTEAVADAEVAQPVMEIPQIEDVDYAKQSEDINNRIKENYDANMDSAFSDDNN